MKLLVNSHVDVNTQDSKAGKTALHCAVEKGDLTMTGYLLTQVGVHKGLNGRYMLGLLNGHYILGVV